MHPLSSADAPPSMYDHAQVVLFSCLQPPSSSLAHLQKGHTKSLPRPCVPTRGLPHCMPLPKGPTPHALAPPHTSPSFSPSAHLTQECLDALDLNKYGFLWPDELTLAQHILKSNEHALAWTDKECGHFCDDYFTPVKIPMVEHIPWTHRSLPIPSGIMDEVIKLLKHKIATGMYEPSNTSYRSCWFCVKKKNGLLRLVHNLQPLNMVTICNDAVPPFVDRLVESMAM